jgi:phage tail protein X
VDKSIAAGGDDWGYQPGKGGMAIESKLGMFIIMILLGAFGFLVYRNVDRHQTLLADSEELDPAGSPTEVLDQMADRMRADGVDQDDDAQAMSFADLTHKPDSVESNLSLDDLSLSEPSSTEIASVGQDPSGQFEFQREQDSREATNLDSFGVASAEPNEGADDPFASSGPEANDSLRGGVMETESLTAATKAITNEFSDTFAGSGTEPQAALREETPSLAMLDVDATEAVEDGFSTFGFDSEEPMQDSSPAREEPVAELLPQEPVSEDNQFPVAQEDGLQVAKSTSGQTLEQPELTVSSSISRIVLEEEETELGVGQDVRFEFDTESALSRSKAESLLVDSTDENPAAVVDNGSIDPLPVIDDDSFEDTDSRLTVAMLDDEAQGDFQDAPDIAEPSMPLLFSGQDSTVNESDPIAFDSAFSTDEGLVLKDARPESGIQLRPVTPVGGEQPARDKFDVREFAYENRVVTASAENEPCEVCEVQPGDNYWKISRRAYGTTQYFSALALYNHNRVGDPKKLRPGMKVLLPDAELLEKKYPKLFPDSSPRSRKPGGYFVQPDGTAAYRIGEKDTLSQIAQKHLGRSSRWIQIYRLNPNVLSNPNRLKPGTVIILPDSATDVHMVP